MPFALKPLTISTMLACSSGRNLLLDILTKKKVDAHWLPSLTAACMDNLAGGKQLHTSSPCNASNCNLALQLALYFLVQHQSQGVRCTAGLCTCHICLAEPRLLLEQNKIPGQALGVCTTTLVWSNLHSMPWTHLPFAALANCFWMSAAVQVLVPCSWTCMTRRQSCIPILTASSKLLSL